MTDIEIEILAKLLQSPRALDDERVRKLIRDAFRSMYTEAPDLQRYFAGDI